MHFNFDPWKLPGDATVVIAEGALKADALSALRPELYVVATAGVSANHAALVDLTRGRRALIGFDQDYHRNEVVCLKLAALIARRMESERTLATTLIASWDRSVKGIDDAALRNLPITSISVEHWINRVLSVKRAAEGSQSLKIQIEWYFGEGQRSTTLDICLPNEMSGSRKRTISSAEPWSRNLRTAHI